ncbi:prepilin-type N-terminal cleavage/methylation domain-containing protein [Massilia sp. CCM 8733]|uniref:Type II secretion system protein H n=1 Tax=Massilia mucilaginosa TaxID=2609282 RepID=A0ABX0NR34_9BURK|nr:GspH/FimT family protein [Massilia mucilaginosa]NHZ89210.1 prepilin-type N-terminal cleavage/methylation domain-containing protein [Massilia mucilaginosa]
MTRAAPPPANAFSLVELMAVLLIAAIALAVAVPDLRAMIRLYQLNAAVNDLSGAIGLTRAQAMARGQRVVLAPLEPAGTDWSLGWVAFVDHDGDRRPGASDELIATHGPVGKGIVVSAVFSSQKLPDYLAYNSAGRSCTATSSAAARWGTLSLFQGEQTRRIKINMLGRARVCDPARDGANCEGEEEES